MSYVHNSGKKYQSLIVHLGALIAVSAWGASFVSTKVLTQHGLNAVEIYICRFLIAYVLTLLICPRPFFSRSKRDELMFLLCGICGGSVYFIAENTAVIYTLVSNVSLITALSPIITFLIATLVFKTEKLSRGFLLGSLMALIGVACVIFNSSMEINVKPFGDMLAFLAAISWAIYTVVLRPLNATYSAWFISRKTFFYGLITALPLMLIEPTHTPMSVLMSTEVLVNIGFLGLICSFLAYLLWALTIRRLGAVKGGNYIYFCPVVTLILSAFILGESITFMGIAGCVLILGGVIMSEKLSSRAQNHRKVHGSSS